MPLGSDPHTAVDRAETPAPQGFQENGKVNSQTRCKSPAQSADSQAEQGFEENGHAESRIYAKQSASSQSSSSHSQPIFFYEMTHVHVSNEFLNDLEKQTGLKFSPEQRIDIRQQIKIEQKPVMDPKTGAINSEYVVSAQSGAIHLGEHTISLNTATALPGNFMPTLPKYSLFTATAAGTSSQSSTGGQVAEVVGEAAAAGTKRLLSSFAKSATTVGGRVGTGLGLLLSSGDLANAEMLTPEQKDRLVRDAREANSTSWTPIFSTSGTNYIAAPPEYQGPHSTVYPSDTNVETGTPGFPDQSELGRELRRPSSGVPPVDMPDRSETPAIPMQGPTLIFSKKKSNDRVHAPNPDHGYYTPPQKVLPGFPDATLVKRKSDRKRWLLPSGEILEWDKRHGDLEKWDKTGNRHLGSYDPETGGQTSSPDKTKKPIDP